jgi:hypothetical protein
MAAEHLADVVNSLTPEQQESVRQFIDFLRKRESSASSALLQAAGEFIAEHPELLQRLAQ